MTLSNRERSRRAIVKAAKDVANGAMSEYLPEDVDAAGTPLLLEVISEHIGWEFDAYEQSVALDAFRAERERLAS